MFGDHVYTIVKSISLQTNFSHDLLPDIVYNLSSLPTSLFLSPYLLTETPTLSALISSSETLPLGSTVRALAGFPGLPESCLLCGRGRLHSLRWLPQIRLCIFVSSPLVIRYEGRGSRGERAKIKLRA